VINSFQKNISSEALPQYKTHSSSKNFALLVSIASLSGINHVTPSAHPRGVIEIL